MTMDIAVKAIKGQPQDLSNTLLKDLGSAASAGLVSGLVQGTAAMGTARAMDYTTDFSGITDRGPLNPGIRIMPPAWKDTTGAAIEALVPTGINIIRDQ